MPEDPTGKARGPLRALSDWLRGATPAPHPTPKPGAVTDKGVVPARIGHYVITGKLGRLPKEDAPAKRKLRLRFTEDQLRAMGIPSRPTAACAARRPCGR